jgi:hypothetical protein
MRLRIISWHLRPSQRPSQYSTLISSTDTTTSQIFKVITSILPEFPNKSSWNLVCMSCHFNGVHHKSGAYLLATLQPPTFYRFLYFITHAYYLQFSLYLPCQILKLQNFLFLLFWTMTFTPRRLPNLRQSHSMGYAQSTLQSLFWNQ